MTNDRDGIVATLDGGIVRVTVNTALGIIVVLLPNGGELEFSPEVVRSLPRS